MQSRTQRLNVIIILMLLLTACVRQPEPTPTPAGPTVPTAVSATTQPPTAAPQSTAPVAATSVATAVSPPFTPIALAPINIQLPEGFKPVAAGSFASFQMPAVKTDGSLPATNLPGDLSGVTTLVLLSPAQRDMIAKQGFVVSPSDSGKFFEVYERNRYDYIPSFITSDSVLHAYHQAFDGVLRHTEMVAFAPALAQLDYAMLQQSVAYYQQLAGTPWEEAARRNAAYFAVAVALLEPGWQVPEQLADLVQPELDAVRGHAGQKESVLFSYDTRGEDYSQYTPRGHYTRNEQLTRYFQAMMWHGRRSFSAAKDNSAGLLTARRQEVLMLQALREAKGQKASALELWNSIYEPTSFFVGQTDGLMPRDAIPDLEKVYGPLSDIRQITDDSKLDALEALLKNKRTELIKDQAQGESGPIKIGMRFMGSRLVPDAEIFMQLLDPNVPKRMVVSALDVFAALGSDRALTHLEAQGATAYDKYSPQITMLQKQYAGLPEAQWSSTVYYGWLNTLRPLLETMPEGYPTFMRNNAWRDKQLHTALGSYAELKHDTILYAKQAVAEAGFLLPPPTPDLPRGYVEPMPLVYARIIALSQMTRNGLSERGLLSEQDATVFDSLIAIATQLQKLSEKELAGVALSDEEAQWISQYGVQLENLARNAETDPGEQESGLPPPSAIVADISSSPAGVVHIGDGKVFHILVAVPVDGKTTVMRGGVYSFYEFLEQRRLSDEDWRADLDKGKVPPRPAWTGSFEVNETQASLLSEQILAFNDLLVNLFWYRNPDMPATNSAQTLKDFLTGTELEDTLSFIKQLESRNQFMGMKRMAFDFRSFDIAGDQATVTTREQWQESVYAGNASELEQVPAALRQRVYTANVTYTLVQQNGKWLISKIVVQEQS